MHNILYIYVATYIYVPYTMVYKIFLSYSYFELLLLPRVMFKLLNLIFFLQANCQTLNFRTVLWKLLK
jgi:hypothetical protein